jgi:hypothetical protein
MSMKASEVGAWLGRTLVNAITTNSCRRITLWCGRDRTSTGSWARAVQHGRTLSRRHLDSLQPAMTAPEPERRTRQRRGCASQRWLLPNPYAPEAKRRFHTASLQQMTDAHLLAANARGRASQVVPELAPGPPHLTSEQQLVRPCRC